MLYFEEINKNIFVEGILKIIFLNSKLYFAKFYSSLK